MRRRVLPLQPAKLLLFLALAATAQALPVTTIAPFTGGDPGEGLNFLGKFQYAVNVRGPGGGQIGSALFTTDSTPGVTISAQNEIINWHNPNYGNTANDNALEVIMQSIRWSAQPALVTVDLAGLVAGGHYKLQMLFAESCCNRAFDVTVEGSLIADDFNVQAVQGGINNLIQGAAITYDFIAGDATLNIVLDGSQTPPSFPDRNPILNAFTLEVIPEPTTLSLLALGGLGLLRRRKR